MKKTDLKKIINYAGNAALFGRLLANNYH